MTGRRPTSRSPGLGLAGLCVVLLVAACPARAAQSFGDLLVSPQSPHDGDTHHGYRELRVLLENLSPSETRRVTLVLPDRFHGWAGNSIRRLQRTAVLAPGAQAAVSLWQPPLPMFGGGGMEVIVDGESLGTASLPNPQRHMTPTGVRGHSTGIPPATFLVSRSLDHDEVSRSLHGGGGSPFSAAQATGAPDAGTHRGMHPNTWMPDPSTAGPHWIELVYATPIAANHLQIHETTGVMGAGSATLVLRGVSGTNLVTIPIRPVGPSPARLRGLPTSVAVPPTAEPVRSVRLEFNPGLAPCIDAVAVASPSGSQWAASASASSDASSVAGAYLGGMPQGHRQFLRAELPVSEWSEAWLSYTPYDAIVLGRTDQSLLPAPVLAALRSYVEAGGNLFLLGNPDARKPWQGSSETLIGGGHRIDVGFGRCFVFPAEKPSDLTATAIEAMLAAADAAARFWQSLPSDEGANGLFPVVENVAIPIRGIVLVMLAFILLIGPANLIILSRLNRRTWMLWTIPAISLAACGLVFVYSFVREGFTPDCRHESLTLLDQASHRATSVGAAAFYCPLTPNEGLRFSPDTEATPLVALWDYRSGTQREIDWTQSQHLQRGWVTARVPTHLHLRKSEIRRERLQLAPASGGLEVVNGLGAPVVSLLLSDPAGRLYQASQIAAGQKARLAKATESLSPGVGLGPRPLFIETGYAGHSGLLATNGAAYLLPGTYLAELDGSPFLENGLGDRRTRTRTRAFVYGILEPPATP